MKIIGGWRSLILQLALSLLTRMAHTPLFIIVGAILLAGLVAAQQTYNPVANTRAVVLAGNARFTVLTSRLIRMEYDPSQQFEDKASYVFLNRNLPVPNFNTSTSGHWTTITTDHVVLRYNSESGPFENGSVSATIDNGQYKWAPGMSNSGNLLGTVRTLDTIDGSLPIDCKNQPKWDLFCTYGLVSRDGWVIVNDSISTLFDGDSEWDWIEPRDARAGASDWYLFAHGHDYRGAMKDFTKVAMNIPLPPRSTFGIFFSRYWAFSDVDFKNLVTEYETNDVPLDMLVMDMDWHITFYKEARKGMKDQANQTIGWTGYTFDSHLFPDPEGFLSWLNNKGIHATMNLHPASGVQPWEEFYPEMANAMGVDPSTNVYVPFHITHKQFAANLMDIMLRPLEEIGIRFWWLDWQQWQYTEIENMNPTAWLNYVFTSNYKRIQSQERPVILHRWGGLGNHKFPWGFSGDVVPTWASLQFQPYFTHTAANVGYMWSHDIGGHTRPSPPELYTRWVQWGIFSPVFRPHCTKDSNNDRRIWIYPYENFKIMKDAFHLRERMIPYIYTYARKTSDTGVTFLYPMYYDYPEFNEAYTFRDQYMFGEQLMVSPVLTPMDNVTQLSLKTIWVPPGNWVEWSTGREYIGPQNITRAYTLDEIPVFAKSGTIMPLRGQSSSLLGEAQRQYADLHFKVFLGSAQSGLFQLYEDEGNTIDYITGASTTTKVSYSWMSASRLTFTVDPSVGSYATHPATRAYTLELFGIYPAVSVTVNGVAVPYIANPESDDVASWSYDGATLSLLIRLPGPYSTASKLTVNVRTTTASDPQLTSGISGCLRRLETIKVVCDYNFPQVFQEDYTGLIDAAGYAHVMSYTPEQVPSIVSTFQRSLNSSIAEVSQLNLPFAVKLSAVQILQTC